MNFKQWAYNGGHGTHFRARCRQCKRLFAFAWRGGMAWPAWCSVACAERAE